MKLNSLLPALACIALLVLFSCTSTASCTELPDAARPERFIVDNPTPHHLAFRWLVRGDADGDASVSVQYRAENNGSWHRALPLWAVSESKGLRMFAGSVLNLQPATAYEVRFILADPDGGRIVYETRTKTRPVPPESYPSVRQLHVYPSSRPQSNQLIFPTLAHAFREAQAGDLVLVHAGTYKGPFSIAVSGSEERPIVFRNAGDGEVVLENLRGNVGSIVAGEDQVDYVHLEGLTFRASLANALKVPKSMGWVIRRCVFLGGLTVFGDNWYVTDNILIGRYAQWRKRLRGSTGTGIKIYGRGHVISHNRVSYFWDGIAVAGGERGEPGEAFAEKAPGQAIDISNNLVFAAVDDAIEVDNMVANVRVQRNRVLNSLVGISLQETGPGPVYVTHNVVSNVSQDPWKIFGSPTGLRLYHNTSLGWHSATRFGGSRGITNSIFLNNIFLGFRSGFSGKSSDERTRLDHNAYRLPQTGSLIRWSRNREAGGQEFASLEEVARHAGTELGSHNVLLDETQDLAGPVRFDFNQDYRPGDFDLQLSRESAAIDAGLVVPTVNEGFRGGGPDLGAHEYGAALPVYGPRMGTGASSFASAYLTMEPIGNRPLGLKENIVLLLDTYNIPVRSMILVAFLAGTLVGAALTFVFMRWRRRKGTEPRSRI